jgi:SiaC family regulatory phosphoprotein
MSTEKSYNVAGTGSTPQVAYSTSSGLCSLIGVSTPVDSMDFYRPIIEWVMDNQSDIQEGTQFEFQLNYFNSSSMKALLWLIQQISELIQSGKDWKLVWVVLEEDEFMQEGGEAIQSLIDSDLLIESRN